METFICEICGVETPVEYEGSEPNTCCMCMPIIDIDFKGENGGCLTREHRNE